MPIFDQGYQHWQGTLSSHAWRWLTVTRHGVRVQLKNRWTRIIMLFAWVPAAGLVAALALWGLAERNADILQAITRLFGLPPQSARAPQSFRVIFWTYAYRVFFDIEVRFSMLLVLLIGPNLISQDLRFNALPLYFSRPLRRSDYFLGKLGVIVFCLGAVMVVPAVVAYVFGLAFSLDLSVLKDTFHLLPAAIAYGVLVAVVCGTVMLGLSSLSRNSRYVAFSWVILWFVSSLLSAALVESIRDEWCHLISFTGNLERVGDALLDVESARQEFNKLTMVERGQPRYYRQTFPEPPWTWSAAVLLGLMGLSLWILASRVKSLDRLK